MSKTERTDANEQSLSLTYEELQAAMFAVSEEMKATLTDVYTASKEDMVKYKMLLAAVGIKLLNAKNALEEANGNQTT